MRWTDRAVITSIKPFGEKGKIVTCLTENYGLHKGLLKRSSFMQAAQPGTITHVTWTGRLREHLGAWTFEPFHHPMALLLDAPLPLAALSAACGLIEVTIPERENVSGAFEILETCVRQMTHSHEKECWKTAYIQYERLLLALMGFQLKLDVCAVTGLSHDLTYISPKSGKAVSSDVGKPYHDKLMPLSPALTGKSYILKEFYQALQILGYFLDTFILQPHGTKLPPSRDRFLSAVHRSIAKRAIPLE